MHLQHALEIRKSGSVQSVFMYARRLWSSVGNALIHAATRVGGPLGINMSHTVTRTDDGVVL